MKLIKLKTLITSAFMLLVAGCGGSKQQAMLDTIGSPQPGPATFEALREDMGRAQADKVNLISPERYLEAKKSFDEAERMKSSGQPENQYRGKLEESRKALDAAVAFSLRNKERMAPLMEARESALASDLAKAMPNDLKALEKKYVTLVFDLDRQDTRNRALSSISDLTEDYRKLTIKGMQAKYLGEAMNNLELAKDEGAESVVPKTYRETETSIQKARAYITQAQTPETVGIISELGNAAASQSRRLLVLTRQAKILKGMSAEEISLKTESLLNSAGASLEGKDLRDMSFEAHAAALNESIAQLKNEKSAFVAGTSQLRSDLTQSKTAISELERKTQKYSQLEQREESNKKFETVRELFDEEEAKVYRQGNTLVISLKQINFPVNKSEIPTPSYDLLKKVQTAIRSFAEPSVVVEGHTDSTGSSELNKALSESRAEAVKSYLLSNEVISSEKVVAVGYGSEKPLASNKSNAGRAINRRIDVVIKE